jgi:hypothetical protein
VIRWIVEEVLNTGNLAAVDALCGPDQVAHVPLWLTHHERNAWPALQVPLEPHTLRSGNR